MKQHTYQEIMIHLEDISELFIIPTPDPFSPHVRFVPGITVIQTSMTAGLLRRANKTRVTIFLPEERIEPDMSLSIKEAIRRYTRFKAAQNHRESLTLHREAFEALLTGILLLSCGLFLPASIERVLALPTFFSSLFSEGFTLAFWVILWRPIDFFLFDASSTRKENRINKRLLEIEVLVLVEDSKDDTLDIHQSDYPL